MSYLEINNSIDIIEDRILQYDESLLQLLLKDKSTGNNIIWATEDYADQGVGYEFSSEIVPELITGPHTLLIQPRSAKSSEVQGQRTRSKAEVFTPSWVCNKQNNLVDTQWFGRPNIFNHETDNSWEATQNPVVFPSDKRNWKKYVDAQRLEISCGEAPYLVSRYDTVTGDMIELRERIGLFDRKMRIVEENAADAEMWVKWSIRALQSVFGYEYQGDNLLLARENLLLSYVDYYKNHFKSSPSHNLLKKVANIIAWNLWQMDGQRYVVPGSCKDEDPAQFTFFPESVETRECPGCKTGDPYAHNGTYCRVNDWRTKRTLRFVDMIKGAEA